MTISSKWKIENGKNVVLCLNGKTLTADNANVEDTILIEGTLTITDCKGAGTITGTNTSTSGNHKAIVVSALYSDCALNLYGGKITGIHSGGYNGGVHNEGTFNMYGGTITGNTAPSGSGVDNYKNGSHPGPAVFSFYGGTIKDNISKGTDGAEIHNRSNSTISADSSVTFSGTVSNSGSLSGGTFNGAVTNWGTISGGTYNDEVTNYGTVSGTITNNGTFYNLAITGSNISGATFTGTGNVATISFSGSNYTITAWTDNSGENLTNAIAIVSTTTTLKTTISVSNVSTIKLGADVTLTEIINITDGRNVTIDLNGHTITANIGTAFKANNGELTVSNGTIAVKYEAFRLIGNTTLGGEAKTAKLTVNSDVTVTSTNDCCIYFYGNGAEAHICGSLTSKNDYAAIQGNGTVGNTTDNGGTAVTIYPGAKVINTKTAAFYIPQRGTITILGGEITGVGAAIALKSGKLNISGGTLKATGEDSTPTQGFSNGVNVSGAAIQIESNKGYVGNPAHTKHTELDNAGIDITISGGTIESANSYAVYEYLDQGDSEAETPIQATQNTSVNSLNITGGTFKSASAKPDFMISEELSNKNAVSITGGTFSQDPSDYVAEGYIVMKDGEKFTVVTNSGLTSGTYLTVPSVAGGYYYVKNNDNTYTVCCASSGGSSNPTYTVTAPKTDNGSVSLSPKSAKKGSTVTITVTPDSGYTLETLTVLDKNGNEIELTNNGDGTYSFKMPAGKVEVKATFMEDNSMLNFFTDVPADKYYYGAVLWTAKNGITGGVDDTHFAPDAACTRAQIVTFLYRWAKALGVDLSAGEDTNILSYNDAFDIPEYAIPAFQWAVSMGIIQGSNGNLMSGQTCTRAQIVTILYRSAR